MKTRTALITALTMSGQYDIPGEVDIVHGRGIYGEPKEERIPRTDMPRLLADVEAILRGDKPSPIREISSISIQQG